MRCRRVSSITSTAPPRNGRIAVVATLDGNPVAVPSRPPVLVDASQLGTTGDAVALYQAIGWALLFAATVVLAVRLYRRWPSRVAYVTTTPLLLMLLLLVFQALNRLLPGTL